VSKLLNHGAEPQRPLQLGVSISEEREGCSGRALTVKRVKKRVIATVQEELF